MRLLAALLFLATLAGSLHAQVAINEFMPVNNVTLADDDGDYGAWLELYNYSEELHHLHAYGLSDDPGDPWKWVFPDVVIPPGEFMIIWLSGKDRSESGSPLHTGFTPAHTGTTLRLTSLQGVLVDASEAPQIPSDHSWGRYPDGTGTFRIFTLPTPGESNLEEHLAGILSPPEFSIRPGFYSDSLLLQLHHEHPDVTLYYTTDGSVPDTSSLRYDGPIGLAPRPPDSNSVSMIRPTPPEGEDKGYGWFPPQVPLDKGHTIRAVAAKPGWLTSPPATGTWFPGLEQTELPVLSITVPEESFFDSEHGIYVPGAIYDSLGFGDGSWGRPNANYFQRGEEWEREASLEWFEDGQRVFQQDIGVRIHGGGSRALPQKSLRLYARSDYGQTHIRHQVFPEEPYSEYKRLILRNSGQDFFRRTTMFRDAFMQRLVGDLNVETQAYRPSVLFLNGEYWGIHNIRERYDKHYFERRYEVREEHLDLLELQAQIKEGDNAHYLDMLAYIEEHGVADPVDLEHVSGMMDLENFIDYNILQLFFRNTDWPGNNMDFWRYSGPPSPHIPEQDGRWRWLVFDLDFGFGLQEGHGAWEFDMVRFVLDPEEETYANRPWATFLLRSLLENPGFRDAFLRRFSDLLNATFTPEHMKPLIREMADVIQPEIPPHIERWSHPPSFRHWEQHVGVMLRFADERPQYQFSHLQNHFDLQDPKTVSVVMPDAGIGRIHLNTLELGLPRQGPEAAGLRNWDDGIKTWEGRYFPDVPVRLAAEPSAGYRFSHWVVNGDTIPDPVLELHPEDNTAIHPHFVPDGQSGDALPEPFVLTDTTSYRFDRWDAGSRSGTYPPNMAFVYMDRVEPPLNAAVAGFTSGSYDLDGRTRITGRGEDGFAFINTSNLDGNPGYPGRRLGGAILALNTVDADQVMVSWEAGTVSPNSREYALRLQYRVGDQGPFRDVVDTDGNPYVYVRSDSAGHQRHSGPLPLPPDAAGKPRVELLWRYYHTGMRFDPEDGSRSKLHIAAIEVQGSRDTGGDPGDDPDNADNPDLPDFLHLGQNYPNPFNTHTRIPFLLHEPSHVTITVHDVTGRKVALLVDEAHPAGRHTISFDARSLASGVYLYRMSASGVSLTRSMVLIK
ncbi:MAG: T9SS C-terminal target domain-containing protein [Balneolaceae bacterium]|nr:MAG: T9SS C-terminal target domain-containing protein [Balneolaceae bacterium]